KSCENRDIWAMKVSDNVAVNETDEPDILYMGMHHAREWMTVEVPIYFLNYLVNNYGTDPEITYLVDNRELWIIPMVNPDGYQYSRDVDSNWRKNRRDNGDSTFGVDLNRNYNGSQNGDSSGAWGGSGASDITSADTYCGPEPFSEPCTQAIRDLVIEHASNSNKFILSVSYHSYAEDIYYPWGYATSATTTSPDWQLQRRIAENLSTYNGYTVMQSGDTYLTTGDTDDWIYGYSKYVLGDPTYPFTIELDTSFQPPTSQIPITCEKHIGVNLYLAEIADNPAQEYPVITHTPLLDTKNTTGPYTAIANITSNIGLNSSALKLVWRTGTVSDTTVTLSPTGNPDEYYADIPGQSDGTWFYYYIYTEDSGGNKSTSPETEVWESQNYYKFYVGEDRVTYTVYNLAPNATKTVNLTVTSLATALPEEVANIKVIVTS
ncbi:zinc carboxypeptidase, partial [archaeon]|nr:zinc carboxypeptidase [archaeon]